MKCDYFKNKARQKKLMEKIKFLIGELRASKSFARAIYRSSDFDASKEASERKRKANIGMADRINTLSARILVLENRLKRIK